MADQATLQSQQVKELEEKMKNIDKLTQDQVYADPLRKL